jgi:4-hydroxybenzoate polyprenyltransferase
MNPTLGLLQGVRIGNGVIAGLGFLLGATALPYFPTTLYICMGIGSTLCLLFAGNLQNDFLDMQVDKVSHSKRPLITGILSLAVCKYAVLFLYTIGVLLPLFYGSILLTLYTLLLVLIIHQYNIQWKKEPWMGNIIVAFLCSAPIYYVEAFWIPYHTGYAMTFAFLTTWAREIIKDIQDIPGDILVQRKTLPIVYGSPFAQKVVGLLFLLVLALVGFSLWSSFYSLKFGVLAIFTILLPTLWILHGLFRQSPNWNRLHKQIKWLMLSGTFSLFLEQLNIL